VLKREIAYGTSHRTERVASLPLTSFLIQSQFVVSLTVRMRRICGIVVTFLREMDFHFGDKVGRNTLVLAREKMSKASNAFPVRVNAVVESDVSIFPSRILSARHFLGNAGSTCAVNSDGRWFNRRHRGEVATAVGSMGRCQQEVNDRSATEPVELIETNTYTNASSV
jgi:hypothetical protein